MKSSKRKTEASTKITYTVSTEQGFSNLTEHNQPEPFNINLKNHSNTVYQDESTQSIT